MGKSSIKLAFLVVLVFAAGNFFFYFLRTISLFLLYYKCMILYRLQLTVVVDGIFLREKYCFSQRTFSDENMSGKVPNLAL